MHACVYGDVEQTHVGTRSSGRYYYPERDTQIGVERIKHRKLDRDKYRTKEVARRGGVGWGGRRKSWKNEKERERERRE